LPVREVPGGLRRDGGEPHLLQQRTRQVLRGAPTSARPPAAARDDPRQGGHHDVLRRGERRKDRGSLVDAVDAPPRPGPRPEPTDVPSVESHRAALRPRGPADHVEQCRLAGPVRADQRVPLAVVDAQVHAVERGE
jgi:hypothetical protein